MKLQEDYINKLENEISYLESLEKTYNIQLTFTKELLKENLDSLKREFYNKVSTLIMHILKCEFQPERVSGSWLGTIIRIRKEFNKYVTGNLLNYIDDSLEDIYENAKDLFEWDTNLDKSILPRECPYDLNYLMSNELPIQCKEYIEDQTKLKYFNFN